MTIVPIMWSVWGALVLVMAVLYIYRSSLSKNEEDQLFLADSFNHEKVAQAAILDKVNKVQPILRAASWLLGIATLFVVGYYIVDVINQFK
jgi:type VI protein secretion system component VasF